MFKIIKEYYRKKLLKEIKLERSSAFLNIGEIGSLCFVYNINSSESVKELLELYKEFRKRGIAFKGLVFVTKRGVFKPQTLSNGKKGLLVPEELLNRELYFISPDQLSWTGAFDTAVAPEFFLPQYDLFINFNDNNDFTLEYAMRYIKARMSVGMNRGSGNYTLVFEAGEKSVRGYTEYLSYLFNYLTVINSNRGDKVNE